MAHIIPLETVEELIRDYANKTLPKGFYFLNSVMVKLTPQTVKTHWWEICEARRDPSYDSHWLIVGAGYDSEESK
jgi:hypothetical protein